MGKVKGRGGHPTPLLSSCHASRHTGGLLDTTWLSWLLPHLLPNCWLSSRQGLFSEAIPGGDGAQPLAGPGLLGSCAPVPPPSIPPPKSTSAEQTSRPRALRHLRTYHCDSAELLQRPLLLLLAAKAGAAIAELRAVESWLHSTSSAVIQPYLRPCRKDEGQLSSVRRSLWQTLDLPAVSRA